MRFHDSLQDLLANPIRLRVLRVLHKSPDEGFTGRELSRIVRASPSQTNEALSILEHVGVVAREPAGASHLWRLATEHAWFKPISRLFEAELAMLTEMTGRLSQAVSELPVRRAVLFGSVARGDEGPSSDIDLFVEVSTDREKVHVQESLSALSVRFAARFGNTLSSLVATRDQLARGEIGRVTRAVERDGVEVSQ